MLLEELVVLDVLEDVEAVLLDVFDEDVPVLVEVVLETLPLLVEESVEASSVEAAGVPWIESDPMPEALESKLFCSPFSVTVTTPGLPARMVMESVTVYLCSQGPVTVLASSLVPSLVISSQEVSPLATDTVTTVSAGVDESEDEPSVEEPSAEDSVPVVVVVVDGVDDESVEVASVDVASVDVVLTGTVVFDSWEALDLPPTQERTEKTRISVSATARARMMSRVVLRPSCPPRPREPPESPPRCPSVRRRTLGLSTLAMFRDERLPEMVEARS